MEPSGLNPILIPKPYKPCTKPIDPLYYKPYTKPTDPVSPTLKPQTLQALH